MHKDVSMLHQNLLQERADKMAHSDSVARQKKWNDNIKVHSD